MSLLIEHSEAFERKAEQSQVSVMRCYFFAVGLINTRVFSPILTVYWYLYSLAFL